MPQRYNVYLKQVELENFKSFGGKLTIPLMEGYMAITGPNGSGKSNITDAILFVLGPRSSKAVRAGRLTDLIFDGGKAKNRADHMKVSLVFDNSDRIMPWDDDIVRLTRLVRVSDNGTDYSSYFFINDRKSSLSEFDNLLTKARISADGYNMVQQGDVTRIVQMGNVERRRILDGISGIASYDSDIDKAEVERAEAQDNLERINIIVSELESQIAKLEKDREDARRYMEAKEALDKAKVQLLHRHHQIEEAKLRSLDELVESLRGEIEALKAQEGDLAAQYDSNEADIVAKEEEIADRVGPEYRELKSDLEAVKVKRATFKDRIERAEEDLEEQNGFLSRFEEAIAENRDEHKAASDALIEIGMKADETSAALDKAKAEEDGLSAALAKNDGEYAEIQEEISRLDKDIDAAAAEEQGAQVAAAKAEALLESVHRAKAELDERLQSVSFDIKDAEWSLQQTAQESAGGSAEELSKRIMSKRKEESELEKQESELREAIRRLDSEYNRLAAEKRASDRFDGGSNAVKAILELRDKGTIEGIHGTIQELAVVDPGFETALAVAAGSRMQAVVVDNDQTASACINHLKKNKLGRVLFLPMNKMLGGMPRAKAIMILKQTEGYATDLIDYDAKYKNVFWYVFQDTLVVDTLENARGLMGGVRLVTRTGELLDASGAMTGGTLNQQALMRFGPPSESKLEELGDRLRDANASLDALVARIRDLRTEIRLADDEMRKAGTADIGIQARIGQLKAGLAEFRKSKQAISEQLAAKDRECRTSEEALAAARRELGRIAGSATELRERRSVLRDRMDGIAPAELQKDIRELRDRIYALREALSDLRSQEAASAAEISGLDAQKKALDLQVSAAARRIAETEAVKAGNLEELAGTELELEALKGIERDMEGSIEGLRQEKDGLLQRRYSLDSRRSAAQDKIELKEGMVLSQSAQIEIVRANIEQLRSELDEVPSETGMPIPSEEEIRRTIRSCEGLISRIGNVNLLAIEEYDERKGRHDALVADVTALEEQITDLERLKDSLNRQKKALLMEAYNAVNTNFKAIYAQLSGGGEAFMDLEDEGDPFAGGLLINAKPKNGKLLKLEALSGGEKSLTALAFIFAIQEYQPSPFYVLDEVDMFLDAVNAEMVAARVKESSSRAQFIQVSLRKVTLAMADHLIGVTRPPSGISKVIMQPDFEEVSKYEEEASRRPHGD